MQKGFPLTKPQREMQCFDFCMGEAEKVFGPKDNGIPFVGFWHYPQSESNAKPRIYHYTKPFGCGIWLTYLAQQYEVNMVFQISHEVVHLLSPIGREHTSTLEEGMATWFSWEMQRKHGQKIHIPASNYTDAGKLVKSLMKHAPDIIKQLRSKTGVKIGEISAQHLLDENPTIYPNLAQKLAQPFQY
ncbi:hypothetical protein [Ferrovibrio sp.]|uniref:hypothetical protein n=1 Tax=Ferrovibrio sp. TaxID=1917215 RepID=UPI0035B3E455